MDDTGKPLNDSLSATLPRDLTAGLVVFLVAVPLCLGIALASRAGPERVPEALDVPMFSGLIAGIIGGIVIGTISGSHTSVSGPAAGLTAVVAAEMAILGSFDVFLLAVFFAGLIQIVLGAVRAGYLGSFFPSSVIKGLLAAIGVILILKQIPHLLGRDYDPEGEMAFFQPDRETTFSEIAWLLQGSGFQPGAATIGVLSLVLLLAWDRVKWLKKSPVPAQLVVVVLAVGIGLVFRRLGMPWVIESEHLVQVPVAKNLNEFVGFFRHPDFSQWLNPKVYVAAVTIAVIASLETLLNLEAVDRLDPQQRTTPASRELVAQGLGNCLCGLIGGLPVTAVIVRGSVNITAGARTKKSAIFHGLLLLFCVLFIPDILNIIPLSALAAILLVTGLKLASPALVRQMWAGGYRQFIPFVSTVVAIVLTDLLVGVLLGLVISTTFILWSNIRRPIRTVVEKHLGGEVVHIELANQVSFLNRAALAKVLDEVPRGGHLLLDAQDTDYIDPDILDLIRDFKEKTGPARGIEVSMVGFKDRYDLQDQTQYVDYSTRELQQAMTPAQVLQVFVEGNERFRAGKQLTRDLRRLVTATAAGQHPLAVVLGCIDSRTPAEWIFDLGMGDIFSVRVAGNVISRKILGSVEYACVVAGAKLVLVLGHTRCGAVAAAVDLIRTGKTATETTGCEHLDYVVREIQPAVGEHEWRAMQLRTDAEQTHFADEVARRNVSLTVQSILRDSLALERLVREGRVAVVGAIYDVSTGSIDFLTAVGLDLPSGSGERGGSEAA